MLLANPWSHRGGKQQFAGTGFWKMFLTARVPLDTRLLTPTAVARTLTSLAARFRSAVRSAASSPIRSPVQAAQGQRSAIV